jgi:hypothetical protein
MHLEYEFPMFKYNFLEHLNTGDYVLWDFSKACSINRPSRVNLGL